MSDEPKPKPDYQPLPSPPKNPPRPEPGSDGSKQEGCE